MSLMKIIHLLSTISLFIIGMALPLSAQPPAKPV